jgi:hypothetical protein
VAQGARRAGEHGHLRDLPVHEALDRAVVGPDAPDRRLARRLVQLDQATPQPLERVDPRPGPAADRDLAHPVAERARGDGLQEPGVDQPYLARLRPSWKASPLGSASEAR